ncbi:MAG: bifunctional DNA-formamidopyrimidine glycosylase/DNA-(apurinic or apyrimidinic site) lyase [Alphaproteobacteria bacterium]|nr:bifunctional DNA-formamidopyrimidine glycosylase/DNA-(apurinic or apyrimidinic site) lyase [Alphaproteobacteria bacterium]
MPELPEVQTILTAIEKSIKNATILKVVVRENRLREKVPEDFAQKICQAKITSYQRKAKYILINLDNGFTILWHLGMSGKVKISEKTPQVLEKHDHILIETSQGTIVYNDARRFGLVTYLPTEKLSEHPLLKNLGIDPFDDNLSAKFLYEKLKNKKVAIKIALLDQRLINGIGNIYASEVLFLAKILPTRVSNELTLKECESIVKAVRIVLTKAIEAGGSTLKDYQKPDGSLGYFQNSHCVYNKTGQKCEGCTCDIAKTGGIKKIVQAGRSTFYCPIKQK